MYPQKSEIADADAGAGFGREKTVGAAATKSEIGEDHKHGDVVAVGEHGEHGEHGGDGEHGERPLFPYPTAKENLQSAMRFFRRFFFILLIIPAWVVPNILTARAKAEMENSHGGGGEGTGHDVPTSSHAVLEYAGLPYATLATLQDGGFVLAGGAGGHGPELSLGANWAIFLLNMFVMMHLGKMANEALEELIPKLGSVSEHFFFLRAGWGAEQHNNNTPTLREEHKCIPPAHFPGQLWRRRQSDSGHCVVSVAWHGTGADEEGEGGGLFFALAQNS